jgi:Holliday junction resolvase RusA-like endonuclease
MTTIRLDYPLSGNRYWRHVRTPSRTLVIVSPEAKGYKASVREACIRAGLTVPHLGPVQVGVTVHPRLRRRGGASNTVVDLDNGLKVLLDALQGYAYIRDSQIRKLAAEYGEAMEAGGVTVTVRAFDEYAA